MQHRGSPAWDVPLSLAAWHSMNFSTTFHGQNLYGGCLESARMRLSWLPDPVQILKDWRMIHVLPSSFKLVDSRSTSWCSVSLWKCLWVPMSKCEVDGKLTAEPGAGRGDWPAAEVGALFGDVHFNRHGMPAEEQEASEAEDGRHREFLRKTPGHWMLGYCEVWGSIRRWLVTEGNWSAGRYRAPIPRRWMTGEFPQWWLAAIFRWTATASMIFTADRQKQLKTRGTKWITLTEGWGLLCRGGTSKWTPWGAQSRGGKVSVWHVCGRFI